MTGGQFGAVLCGAVVRCLHCYQMYTAQCMKRAVALFVVEFDLPVFWLLSPSLLRLLPFCFCFFFFLFLLPFFVFLLFFLFCVFLLSFFLFFTVEQYRTVAPLIIYSCFGENCSF